MLPALSVDLLTTRLLISVKTRLHAWLPALISGTLLAFSFPCHSRNPLAFLFHPAWAWVALIPLLTALSGAGFKQGFRQGWGAGSVFSLLSLYWVAHTQGGGPAVVGGTLLLAAYLGLFTGLFAGAQNLLLQRWGTKALAAAPALWTAQEYLLSLGELGFPWLLLGHSQAVFPALIQHASITGVYGISFWVVLVNVLIYLALSARPRRRLAALAGAVLSFLVPWLYARVILPPSGTGEDTVRVALIQPSMTLEEKWGPNGLERSFAALEELSQQAAERSPDLLVWPETAVPCYLRFRPDCRRRAEGLVDGLQIPLLTGASDYDYDRREPLNAAFFLRPDTSEMQTYAKMHLVPFGERTPFRDRIPLLRDIDWTVLTGDLGPAEFAPGTEPTLFAHPQAPFAVLICFESVFPDLVRRSVARGARLLVNITNDSWFGRTAGPYQHAQLSIVRAVENRTAIARCATSGISLFIDPFGRTFQATELFAPAVAVRDLPVGQGGTWYTGHGDVFARLTLLAAALCLLGTVSAFFRHRRV